MKKIKQCISAILSTVLIISSYVFPVYAANTDELITKTAVKIAETHCLIFFMIFPSFNFIF